MQKDVLKVSKPAAEIKTSEFSKRRNEVLREAMIMASYTYDVKLGVLEEFQGMGAGNAGGVGRPAFVRPCLQYAAPS